MARRLAVLACALASLVSVAVLLPAGASANGTRSSQQSGAAVDLGVLQQLNRIRAAHHLAPLSLCPKLRAAALQHSREMIAKGYFAHNSSDGEPFWKRIMSFYPEP